MSPKNLIYLSKWVKKIETPNWEVSDQRLTKLILGLQGVIRWMDMTTILEMQNFVAEEDVLDDVDGARFSSLSGGSCGNLSSASIWDC